MFHIVKNRKEVDFVAHIIIVGEIQLLIVIYVEVTSIESLSKWRRG